MNSQNPRVQSLPKKKNKKTKIIPNIKEENFGFDFNAELVKEEEKLKHEVAKTKEEQKKYEDTQRHVQEQNIKKIYSKVRRKTKTSKDPKIKNVKRMNKQNLKLKYSDKFLGKVNSYKTRYYSNGFSKKLYLDKYKKEQDKLDKEADFGMDLEELNRQDNIGKIQRLN